MGAGVLALCTAGLGCAGDGDRNGLGVEAVGVAALVAPGYSGGRRGFALGESEDGTFLLVSVEDVCTGDDCDGVPSDRVVAARYDADLSQITGPLRLANASVDSRLFVAACGRSNGAFNAAWSNLNRLVEGVNLDTANVEVVNDSDGEPFIANENTVGSQANPHVACLGGADLVVTWESTCTAVQRNGNVFVHFTPDDCVSEPEDGLYFQLFDQDGNRKGPLEMVVRAADGIADEAGVAPLPDRRWLLAAGALLQVRDDTGAVIDEVMFDDGPGDDPLVSCSDDGICAVVWSAEGVRARIVDAQAIAEAADVVVEEAVFGAEPDPVFVLPLEAGLACDPDGVCLVSWRSVREVSQGDVTVTEEMGVFARALDARTGTLGPETLLVAAEEVGFNGSAPALVSIGSGEFAAVRSLGDALSMQRVDVR
jgi:hypothetical protein